MRVVCTFCGLFLAIAIVNCSPIVKRDAEEPSPEDLNSVNEIYVFETDDEATDGENKGRDKRKIGLVVGISNGIMNFVFGKANSLLDSKIRALDALEEANKAKNAIYGIDPNKSATAEFVNKLVSQKIQAASSSIGPLINGATTFFSGASSGLTNAFVSKFAPLSSLSGGLSGGGAGGSGGSAPGSNFIGTLLTQGIGTLSSLSQTSGNLGSLSGGISGGGQSITSGASDTSSGAQAGVGLNIGAFGNLAGKVPITTTTDNTPIFDRNKVSLDIPSRAFGSGFTLVTNVSKVLSSIILNSARRTQTFLEIFKPLFRGSFAIKGLPSDNLH
ncbi:putative lysozyme-like protein [Camponotus floridanus]|uniref:putative lysozyme-like protein n=1 Tax=Camponotus floridanus TaxID=104421 RepID=UPI00059C8DB9|nr:putative lysozyme-like protein [Camponotus floridanus]XP_019885344.1 putative lysozyme-like protein [Camponotus floridanus]XP_019885345.1 putative lysozyme-like protein [Camponotus floridanus]XP_025269349.1 putative lysozyme-like protein [Camponotus floridanus]XP_025269350.1 putative lysozyme-like protein [Camponotus floridanus]